MFVHSVKVTNDVAEQGISMLKSFAGSVKDESQFQCDEMKIARRDEYEPCQASYRYKQWSGTGLGYRT